MTAPWSFVPPWPPTRAERATRTLRHWERQVVTRSEREARERAALDRWADDGGRP